MAVQVKLLHFTWFISSAIIVHCSVNDSFYVPNFHEGMEKINETKLTMIVFYESLCPDSVNFFREQFSENWSLFYDYLNITLVPYGNASQKRNKEGNWIFECQHGEKECFANRIQACAIARMYDEQRKKLFSFVSCYMSHEDKDKYGPKCAHSSDIVFRRLKKCAQSKLGNKLLAKWGNVTHEFTPKIEWVPTIVLNNKYNQTENDLASSDLKSLLCQKLNNRPEACS